MKKKLYQKKKPRQKNRVTISCKNGVYKIDGSKATPEEFNKKFMELLNGIANGIIK